MAQKLLFEKIGELRKRTPEKPQNGAKKVQNLRKKVCTRFCGAKTFAPGRKKAARRKTEILRRAA